jgi:hypothetical protein
LTIKVARVYSPSRQLPSEVYMNLEEVVRNTGSEEVLSQLLGLGHTDDRSKAKQSPYRPGVAQRFPGS